MTEDDEVAAMLRDAANDYLAGRYDAANLQKNSLRPRAADRALWREMAEMGWLGLCLPEAAGGADIGIGGAVILAETFGQRLFLEPFVTAVCIPSELIRAGLASPDHANIRAAEALASVLISGERLLSVAWQEHPDQLDPEPIQTVLRDGRVYGRKMFVQAVESDTLLLVPVATADGLNIVAVSADAPGVTLELAAAGLGSQATVSFEGAAIWQGMLLLQGAAAEMALQRALTAGRIVLSAQLTGLANGCLQKTIDYVGARVQFGRAIGSFQTIQHRCVDLHIDAMLAGASWRHAQQCWQQESGHALPTAATSVAVSAAKARCSEVAVKVARQAVQMHGAMGFAEEVDIGFYLRAAMHAAASLGNAYTHRRRFMYLANRQSDSQTDSGVFHA